MSPTTAIPSDWIDLLEAFEAHKIEYLVVGGYAVALHGRPRFTKDLDLWVGDAAENLARLEVALHAFGAPDAMLRHLRTASREDVLWMGNPPGRVDIVKGIPGCDFAPCYARRVLVRWGPLEVATLSLADLIRAKRASGRPQDLVDAERLERS